MVSKRDGSAHAGVRQKELGCSILQRQLEHSVPDKKRLAPFLYDSSGTLERWNAVRTSRLHVMIRCVSIIISSPYWPIGTLDKSDVPEHWNAVLILPTGRVTVMTMTDAGQEIRTIPINSTQIIIIYPSFIHHLSVIYLSSFMNEMNISTESSM